MGEGIIAKIIPGQYKADKVDKRETMKILDKKLACHVSMTRHFSHLQNFHSRPFLILPHPSPYCQKRGELGDRESNPDIRRDRTEY